MLKKKNNLGILSPILILKFYYRDNIFLWKKIDTKYKILSAIIFERYGEKFKLIKNNIKRYEIINTAIDNTKYLCAYQNIFFWLSKKKNLLILKFAKQEIILAKKIEINRVLVVM